MKEYDIVIVGGGPGGSMAAKVAAEKGLKTIFFERGRKPGEKNSSGCGLGPRMWRSWPDMMKNLTEDKCPSLRAGRFARNYLVDKKGEVSAMILARPTESVTYEPAKSFITMNCYRSEFDPWMADLATNAGAELKCSLLIKGLIKENGTVKGVVDEKGEKYMAPIVIGADGAVSMVAKQSGLRDKWYHDHITLVPQYDFYAPREKIDLIMHEEALAVWWMAGGIPSAYQVFFGDGFHVGLGNWMQSWEKNPLYYLNYVVNLKHFQRLIKMLGAKPREVQAHLLPWMPYPEKTYANGVMLIGDAAGFPCPLEAEGIFPAMESAEIAVEVAAEAIAEGDYSENKLKEYERRWQEESSIGTEFDAGPQLWSVWKALPFNAKNMDWFIPMVSEALTGIFDWSEPHKVRIRQIVAHVKKYLPQAMPTLMSEFVPLFTKALEDDMGKLMDPSIMPTLINLLPKLMSLMPDKKKKRRRRK
ncbi:MAG: NAD(P)/FAD-dependent oxidoreductase [Promethearchaeota archaeon]|nr:MAG: NAD(P)/FAD-dependent oxidoreductase [Candidatus Lokiarchaeota archaeon]